jgi:hypothetical protein
MPATEISAEEFFASHPDAERIYDVVRNLLEGIGTFETWVTKSQVIFRRRIGFACFWLPGRWLREAYAAAV